MLKCPYCGADAVLEDSAKVYRKSYGLIWICSNYPECDAFVGCHQGTDKPKGTLANPALRTLRKEAHYHFDKKWACRKDRKDWYAWLGEHMGLSRDDCHIGMMNEEQCRQVIELCTREAQYATA